MPPSPLRTLIVAALIVPALAAAATPHPFWRHRWHHREWQAFSHRTRTFPLADALPSRRLTPGALNPHVTATNIGRTICVRGYTRTIRPPEQYTERLKRRQIRASHYSDRWLRDYEEDHLIPLELGGSPTSPRNLWPEPHHVVAGWGSTTKDHLENRLHWLVCHHRMSLAAAQRAIASDWITAYRRYVGPDPR